MSKTYKITVNNDNRPGGTREQSESSNMKIECQKNHSGNHNLTRHMGGWECDGCGAYYVSLVVEAQPGLTPFATETTMASAKKSSAQARSIGLSGRIIPV